jgi:hypothetical protein
MPWNLTIIAGGLLGAVLARVYVLESQVNPAQEPVGGEIVLKSESALVVLDVVVTDKKGQPMHGLKSSDFTVLEKDQEMRLQSFEEHRADQIPAPTPLPAKPMSVMDSAMLLGGPNPTQIPFMVKIVPTAGTENTLPPTNQPNVKKMKPPYRHYIVWYGTNLRSLTFTVTPDGTHHGSLEFEALLYSPDGELMNATREMMKVDLPAARYERTLRSGPEFRQNIDAPAKSEYFLRIGVHDVGSDRVGAVEVPLAAIPPAPPAAGGS